MRIVNVSLFLALVAGFGCNTFDPDLGATPFKCGAVEPRCPDDYTCVQSGPGVELCVEAGTAPGSIPDGGTPGTFSCNDDKEIEPNDSTAAATPTAIPDQAMSYSLVGLAICPATDQDFFAFRVASGNLATINAAIDLGIGDGDLRLEILNSAGSPISTGMADINDPNRVLTQLTNAPAGQYFIRITSADGFSQNNYNLSITVSQ